MINTVKESGVPVLLSSFGSRRNSESPLARSSGTQTGGFCGAPTEIKKQEASALGDTSQVVG